MRAHLKKFGVLTAVSAVLLLSGCGTFMGASNPDYDDSMDIVDPFEGYNRSVFKFNMVADRVLIHPVVKSYNQYVPQPIRTGADNALKNLRSPINFTNQALQGDFEGAGVVVVRAVVNTILGVGGLIDVAGIEGIEYESEDFGQTLATWGVGHGPYVVLPLIGPSSARDYAGFAVDTFIDPLRWYAYNTEREALFFGKAGAEYLSVRASLVDVLEDLQKSSIDYYAATRSAYAQRRAAMVKDEGDLSAGADIPDYDYDDE